ncbi:ABC transporter permease [Pedococcus bigeumensis]|uniref:ABC transporter permease n=1 Tax=Pedococcus bigeumensis TaxID=433644 RepID=A0A502CR71_9MICO|nr:ABC transporter permease [Pedococcus bigeumensis]TPG15020.1 ABC transporter permease [Pedococcus bigeumensis]
MSWHGVRTIAALELRQRIRTSRWPIVLVVWVVLIGLVTFLAYWATNDPDLRSGEAMYDIVIFFVLGLSMLIVPSLTATSVNGDREHGVLATLQTTLLSPWDIALGKLLAAWTISVAFLASSLPFLAWAWVEGGISAGHIVLSLLVLVLVLAVVCAIGLMFSTLTARPVASAVLTYLTMGALVFGTTIGFGLSAFLVTQEETQQVYGIPESWYEQHQPPDVDPADPNLTPEQLEEIKKAQTGPTRADCTTFTRRASVAHTERIWWMLPLNPFVVVADAAPSQPRKVNGYYASGFTPMRWISGGSRMARNGPDDGVKQECDNYVGDGGSGNESDYVDPFDAAQRTAPVWPVGLGFLLLAGVGAAVVAGQRLRTPIRRLPNGTRIA